MPSLLVELFSEEIPARLQTRAGADLERLMAAKLTDAGLSFSAMEHFAGPRRLTLHIEGLPEASADTREERKGPKVGAPDQAIQGFLRGAGLDDLTEAKIQETKKGQVYVATIEKKGRPAPELISEALTATIQGFPWPKSQRWGDGELRWVRPLRGIVLTFDGQPVPLSLANGDQPIKAGTTTLTHRVLGTGQVETPTFEAYRDKLHEGCVVLCTDERKKRILNGANALCSEAGLELVDDSALLAELAGLAEWPTPYLGQFDEKFLALPDEVITAAMRGHQKYFSVRDPGTGGLAPRFIAVADIDAGEGMLVGYERVLTARLSDALFLYRSDLKKPLATHAEKLSGTTFFEGLGTLADKVGRVEQLVERLAPLCGVDAVKAAKAAGLAKADLASEMVYEFPELQGLMGHYYALEQNVEMDVADAIRDHYKPAGPSDDLPSNDLGMVVSLADKLDTLASFWSIGKKPTGSGDPFALRRAALAVIRIVTTRGLRLALAADVFAHLPLASPLKNAPDAEEVQETADDLLSFFHDRLAVYFRDQGFRHDHIAAVLTPGADDFVLVEKKLGALSAFLDTEEGANLSAAYKRAANILKAEEKRTPDILGRPFGDLLDAADAPEDGVEEQGEETRLRASLSEAESVAHEALDEENFGLAMRALARVREPLDAFFESVTVNADDPARRASRLAQLLRFKRVVKTVADFDRLEG